MKQLLVINILVFFLSIAICGQTNSTSCPLITVKGPATLVTAGDFIRFTAAFEKDISESKFAFEWTISQGTIIAGQETSEILVATTPEMERTNLTATVKVKGLNTTCTGEYSEIAVISAESTRCFDTGYGKQKSIIDEFGRLDNLFVTLQNDVGTRAFIHFAIEKSENKSKVKTRISKLLRHIDFRKVNRNLIRFDVCYEKENQTTFIVIPVGTEFPDSSNCEKVDIDLK